ncbi:hypothetical protein GLOIN_2v1487796 [Rhizophagus irregularis DAOM 181602=DAOM 197198]|nr:hypothetical protein GLOIN_2v1487796 [Rhizophagus irregularis DAOM 181602=DAOM 197198]
MRALEASEKIVSDTKILDTTRSANKIKKENRLLHKNEGIDYPDHFSLESIQEAIFSGQLKDPGKPGVLWFNTFLKKDKFLPKVGKPLLPSSLRKIGTVFAVVAHGAKNLSKAETIASEALRHSPDNHASPAKNYTIVNYRLRGEPYNQATVFELSGEN